MNFPEVALAVGDSLQDALDYVLARFTQAGFTTQRLDEIAQQLPCRESVALFSVQSSQYLYLFVVVTDPWRERLVIDLLNSLMSLRQAAPSQRLVFQFCSAHPLPQVLAYLFEDSIRGTLECDALLEVRFDFEERIPTDRPPQLARQCQRWVQDYCHHTLYPDQLTTLGWINQFIIEELRAPWPPGQPAPERGYEPINSLIALGCFVGEVLLSQPQACGRWVPGNLLGGIALQLCPRNTPIKGKSWFTWREPLEIDPEPNWEQSILVDPLGKVVRLFREGEEQNLLLFAEVVLGQLEVS
jgi:hypothetical protein